MKATKKGSGLLLVIIIVLALATIGTLLPYDAASKVNLLGYKSCCTFTPISTILCALAAVFVYVKRKKLSLG